MQEVVRYSWSTTCKWCAYSSTHGIHAMGRDHGSSGVIAMGRVKKTNNCWLLLIIILIILVTWYKSPSPHPPHPNPLLPNDPVDHISIWSCSGQFGRQPHLGQTFTNQRGAQGRHRWKLEDGENHFFYKAKTFFINYSIIFLMFCSTRRSLDNRAPP